jgi:hypothetical protein
VSVADFVRFPSVAEIVTFVLFDAGRLVKIVNVVLVAPASTVMLPGTEAISAGLLERVTIRPPVGAGPLSVTVPVDLTPPFTVVGLRDSDDNVTTGGGGFTVSVAVLVAPPRVAVMVTVVDVVTALVVTGNVAVVLVERTVTEAGTVAAAVLLLDSVTTAPPVALSVTVPVDVPSPFTMSGVRDSDVTAGGGGFTVSVAVLVAPPRVAVMVTVVDVVTGLVATVNVAVVPPGGTDTLGETVTTPVGLLDSVTTTPPAGAAALSVTVPVDAPPPVTLVGLRLTPDSVTSAYPETNTPPP